MLTVPKQNWAHGRFREGLNARLLKPDQGEVPWYADPTLPLSDPFDGQRKQEHGNQEEKWYTLVASTRYKGFTKAFVDTVHMGGALTIPWLSSQVILFIHCIFTRRPFALLYNPPTPTLPHRYSPPDG